MNARRWIVGGLLSGLLVGAWAASVSAIDNGGFETGDLSGWASLGDALVVDASFGTQPAGPLFQALIGNGPSLSNRSNPDNIFSFSGVNSVDAGALEAFFGLPPLALRIVPNQQFATEGSGIAQSFIAQAGDVLSFSWNHLTDERLFTPPFPGGHDFSFAVFDGTVIVLGDTTVKLVESLTIFLEESGFRRFDVVIPTTGVHVLGFGVVDTGDTDVLTALLVDRVTVFRPVRIDIKPGSATNPVNLKSHGHLQVAVLGGPALDVRRIDATTIMLEGIAVDRRGPRKAPRLAVSIDDVNRDGHPDLVAVFEIEDLVDGGALTGATTALTLSASLTDGTQIQGTDSVRVVPRKK
jgi:hypothetical protein